MSTTNLNIKAMYNPNAPCNLISEGSFDKDGAAYDWRQKAIVHKATGANLAKITWNST